MQSFFTGLSYVHFRKLRLKLFHFVFSTLGKSMISPPVSISFFFLLNINFTNIITKLIVDCFNRRPEFHQNDDQIDLVNEGY